MLVGQLPPTTSLWPAKFAVSFQAFPLELHMGSRAGCIRASLVALPASHTVKSGTC